MQKLNFITQHTILGAFLAGSFALSGCVSAQAAPQPARSADEFVDSIGVTSPIQSAVPDAVQSVENEKKIAARWEKIIFPRLEELGVRAIRSDIDTQNLGSEARIKRLGQMGVVTVGLFDPRGANWTGHTPAQAVAMLKRVGPQNMIVEGPNEPDLHNINYAFAYNGLAVPENPQGIRDYQKDLYDVVKSDAATKDVPVVMSSIGHLPKGGENITQFCDFLNGHFYAPGTAPGTGTDLKKWRQTYGPKPFMVTETGDHTAVHKTDGLWQPGVPEDVQAKNTARVPFYWFSQGAKRTFIFTLSDGPDPQFSQNNFGMVRFDGTPKPGYTALKNIIALLRDPGPTFTPKPLHYTLEGDTQNVHSVLLQKRNGRHTLVLWQNISSFDPQRLSMVSNPTRRLTLALAEPVSGANVYAPLTNGLTPVQVARGSKFTVEVPDHPLLIELALSPTQLAPKAQPLLAEVPGTRAPAMLPGTPTARPIEGNEVTNYGFESGSLMPWNDFGTGAQIVNEGVFSGTKMVQIGGKNGKKSGKGGVNLGLALKPNTSYIAQMTGRVELEGESARFTITPVGKEPSTQRFTHSDFAPVRVEFTTGSDGSTQLFFWKDAGEKSAYGDNFIVATSEAFARVAAVMSAQEMRPVELETPPTQTAKPLLRNGDFEAGALGGWQDFGTQSQVVAAPVHAGKYAVKIGGKAGKGGVSIVVNGLKPNTPYELRASAKVERANESARVTVSDFGSPSVSKLVTGTDYAPVSILFQTGADKTGASVVFWKDGGEGTAWGDDFEVIAR